MISFFFLYDFCKFLKKFYIKTRLEETGKISFEISITLFEGFLGFSFSVKQKIVIKKRKLFSIENGL